MPRSNQKTKLAFLIEKKDDIVNIMQHEEQQRKIFNTWKLIGFLAKYGPLWNKLAFWVNITLNLLILSSYYDKFDSLNEPRFWH